jgi:hypothetical protein
MSYIHVSCISLISYNGSTVFAYDDVMLFRSSLMKDVFSSSFLYSLKFIKTVAGPEFESYAKCLDKLDPAACVHPQYTISWRSPIFAGTPTDLRTVAKNKQPIRRSSIPFLQLTELSTRTAK